MVVYAAAIGNERSIGLILNNLYYRKTPRGSGGSQPPLLAVPERVDELVEPRFLSLSKDLR